MAVVVLVKLPLMVGSRGEGVERGVGEARRAVAVGEREKRAGDGLGGVEGEEKREGLAEAEAEAEVVAGGLGLGEVEGGGEKEGLAEAEAEVVAGGLGVGG